MADETRDKSNPAPEKAQPQEAEVPASADSETVTLVVVGLPFYVTDYRVPTEDGGMLSFNRDGTEVPSGDADSLIESAAANGVLLERKA